MSPVGSPPAASPLSDTEVLARLRRAIEAAQLRLWEWDVETGEVFVCDHLTSQYGLPGGERIDRVEDVLGLVHPEDRQRALAVLDRVGSGDAAGYALDQRFQGADGVWRWVASRGKVTARVEGRPVRISGTSTDIDERKRAEGKLAAALADRERLEQDLRAADRKKDDFIATLAHELRNPLAPIRSATALLHDAGLTAEQRRECLEVIERQVGQMAHLLEDLLDVSRFTRGKISLRLERLEIATVISQAVEIARPAIDAGSHELVVTLPERPVWLEGDITRLAQIFSNLLTNAAKYSEPRGRIRLTVEVVAERVSIAVADRGIGISADHLPHLFERFSQAEDALRRSQGGLGLGLSLVKGLVELHGGQVTAASPGLGKGSTFLVELPAVPAPEAAPSTERGGAAGPGSPCRVLVVDDNRDVVTTLALVFELEGHDVRRAQDGEEALRQAAEFHPDLVLLDLGMPRKNGYEVCRELRQQPAARPPFVVALTGWGQEDDKRKTSEAGFDLHLVKPVAPEQLLSLIPRAQGILSTSNV